MLLCINYYQEMLSEPVDDLFQKEPFQNRKVSQLVVVQSGGK